jgi:hypothetical protein
MLCAQVLQVCALRVGRQTPEMPAPTVTSQHLESEFCVHEDQPIIVNKLRKLAYG